MARKIKWTEVAWKDLKEEADYIAKDSPHYAVVFVREARDTASSLAYFAEQGRIVPELNNPSIRELFVRSYRMIYQVTEEAVYIIGFIHVARDMWELWKREERPYSEDVE